LYEILETSTLEDAKNNVNNGSFDSYESVKVYNGQFTINNNKSKSMKHGSGDEYYLSGKKWYSGNYRNDLFHGFGVSYYCNGVKRQKGQWLDGKFSGFSNKTYYSDGRLEFWGDFCNQG